MQNAGESCRASGRSDRNRRLIDDILDFCRVQGITAHDFGQIGFGDKGFVRRLRDGRVLTDDQEIGVRVVMEDWPRYVASRGPEMGPLAPQIRALAASGKSARHIAAQLRAKLSYVQKVRNNFLFGA